MVQTSFQLYTTDWDGLQSLSDKLDKLDIDAAPSKPRKEFYEFCSEYVGPRVTHMNLVNQ